MSLVLLFHGIYDKEKKNTKKAINAKNKMDILLDEKEKNQHFDNNQLNKEKNLDENVISKEEIICYHILFYLIEIHVKFNQHEKWSVLDQKYDDNEEYHNDPQEKEDIQRKEKTGSKKQDAEKKHKW